MHETFKNYSILKLRRYEERIGFCLDKLTPDQIWWRGADVQNAAGNLVLHLSGNLTEWILQTLGGDPPSRDRDAEFSARGGFSAQELKDRLHAVVERTVQVIGGLSAERMQERVAIRNYEGTVLEVVYHVVEHFALHTGQIIFAAKLLAAQDLGFYNRQSGAQPFGMP